MEFLQPRTLAEALELKAAHPDAEPIQGGTDVMVDLNFDRGRPGALIDLGHVDELRELQLGADAGGLVVIGAGVTWTELETRLGGEADALAIAARTVGSPQIRNRGTLGGNLGTASPACDGLPPLVAAGGFVEVASAARGVRAIPARDWVVAPRRSAIEPDELVVAARLPSMPVARGSQQFSKIGTRNAMVISVCSLALVIDHEARTVGTGIGSAGPVIIEAAEANEYLAGELDWDAPAALDQRVVDRFAELVAEAARPIDDVRGTAAYRVHALGVMARRTLGWAWGERIQHAQGTRA